MELAARMMLVLGMLFCLTSAGVNAWSIVEQNGGVLNYIAVFVGIGVSVYLITTLRDTNVRH